MAVFEKKLWKYYLDFGRNGQIASTFFATEEEIEQLKTKTIYMDDVLGKHSEVTLDFTDLQEGELEQIHGLTANTLEELYTVTGPLVGGWFYPWDYEDQWDEDDGN